MNNESREIERLFDHLWPICRSITGPGYRESLDILSEIMPTERLRFKTGTVIYDWTVPKEWTPRKAYFIDPKGRKHADFSVNNLHLLGYSIPMQREMSLRELKPHLFTLPDQPAAIPYRTSYYVERWGFCLSHREFLSLKEGRYKVVIDTELKNGSVELGETFLPGETRQEILFSTYLCHPSLANNELSGPLITAFLYKRLAARRKRRFTYRFVVGPETIGTLCYLSLRGKHLASKLAAGFVVTCAGDDGLFTYKCSRRGDTLGDRAARIVLRDAGKHRLVPFTPIGSDERQYCSPGFNLPVGSLMRTMYGQYPEYHTSLDNKDLINFKAMLRTVEVYERVVDAMEANKVWISLHPYGEPQLGKRGLYPTLGAGKEIEKKRLAMMWFFNLADKDHDLLAMAERSGCSIDLLQTVAHEAAEAGLVKTSTNKHRP